MKKALLLLAAVMLASTFLTAAAAVPGSQVWLVMVNRTDQNVMMQLKGYGPKRELLNNYYFTVKPDFQKTFWVNRNVYNRTTWACNFQNSGKLYMLHNTRLEFTPCWGVPANQGQPGNEKVRYYYYYTVKNGFHVKVTVKSPVGLNFHYQY